MKVTNFRELMNGHASAKIYCLYTGNLVRVLKLVPARDTVYVEVDAQAGPVVLIPELTPITYQPWAMDRGNMNFAGDSARGLDGNPVPAFVGQTLKICGEHDAIEYEDGTTDEILP